MAKWALIIACFLTCPPAPVICGGSEKGPTPGQSDAPDAPASASGRAELSVYSKLSASTEIPICSQVGVRIMTKGGNAMDAAVASTICIGIINSFSSGIGGGGFMLIRVPSGDRGSDVTTVDFREVSPSRTDIENYKADCGFARSGGTAVCVPGEVKGLYEAHKRFGRMKWKDLFEDNIEIAKEFTATEQLCARLKRFERYIMADPGMKETYARGDRLVEPGEKIRRTNYARTLEKIAENPDDFYAGEIAESIVHAVKSRGGVMEMDDLAEYSAIVKPPLAGTYLDYKVYTTDAPSSGMFILEGLNILENFNVGQLEHAGQKSGEFPHYHVLIEIFKFMAARRGEISDPAFAGGREDIMSEILSKDYARKLANKIRKGSVLDKCEYGDINVGVDDHGTTHLNVVDKDEMVVLVTSTINLEFGAKFMDTKTGIIFNNEMDDFYVPCLDVERQQPSERTTNVLGPSRRPFSSMSPVILQNDKEIIAVGAAGGRRIPTSILAVIFHLTRGFRLDRAIEQPRIHNQLVPECTYIERNLDKDIQNYLKSVGHKLAVSLKNSEFTSVQGIRIVKDGERKTIEAFCDGRKSGLPCGV